MLSCLILFLTLNNYFSSKKAKIELNYESTVISHSIDKTFKWLRQ